jgi:hypothetical protein
MKPLERASLPEGAIEQSVRDMGIAFTQDPAAACRLCGLPIGSPLGDCLEVARKAAEDITRNDEVWLNDQYQVNIRRYKIDPEGAFGLVHLSIKRIDKEACRDWRDFQEIKNQLAGPECEGVELYPAESRKVDSANQYHLWVVDDPTFRFPWGFGERAVIPPMPGTKSKQREL